jgi:glycosyltransferase involved in cell wall biosynthesis
MAEPVAVIVSPVVPHPPQTGTQKRTFRLIEAIARAGVTPHILTYDPAAFAEREAIEALGWRLDAVPEAPPNLAARARQHLARQPGPYLKQVARRLQELIRERPAWVQLEHGWTAPYLELLSGVRSIWSLHNLDSVMLRSTAAALPPGLPRVRAEVRWRAMRATERWAAPRADVVLCVSEHERAAFEALGAKTMLAPNGIDPDLLDVRADPGDDEVLFFGQLRYEPNRRGILRFLAEGWPAATAARPATRLRIVGEGADEELREVVQRTPGAELVGLVPEVAPELARAAVVIVPVWEGAGTRLKVLEAMAAGRPVVGTALGVSGIGFVDRTHGLIAETPEGLARATVELLDDPQRRKTFGRAARDRGAAFSWKLALEPLEELYRRWGATALAGSLR